MLPNVPYIIILFIIINIIILFIIMQKKDGAFLELQLFLKKCNCTIVKVCV